MKITKYLYIIPLISITAFIATPAYAQETQRMQYQATNSAQSQQQELQNIIKRADILIANRIATLNKLNSRIQNDNKLTSNEKNTLSSEIQANINGLTALKTKIDADTDVATARSDAKQIITNYYIYSIFEPKIRLLTTIANLQATAANLQTLVPQIQDLINTMKSQGKDTTQIQALLTDISLQLESINTTLAASKTTMENISINTSKPGASNFSQVRQDISKTVRENFAKIRNDFAQIKTLLKKSSSDNLIP